MQQTDQLAAMAIFARIVEMRSFTEAAQDLGLSKSALSKELARLETALGVSLLKRTTRRVDVTEVGRAYYGYCARMVGEMKSADAFLKQFQEEPFGNLRLAAPVTFGNRVIVPLLASFIKGYPHVQADLELTDRAVDVAEEGLDLAILISRDKPEQLSCIALMPVAWGLYAAPDYLAQHPQIRTPAHLVRHGFLSFRANTLSPALSLQRGKRQVELKVRYLLRSNNSISLMQAAKMGTGIAYLPRYVAEEAVADGTLRQLLPEWGSEQRFAYATYQESRYLSPRVRLFVEHLERHLAGRKTA
jgi:DNA-binding transcriptional LysR family regulator